MEWIANKERYLNSVRGTQTRAEKTAISTVVAVRKVSFKPALRKRRPQKILLYY